MALIDIDLLEASSRIATLSDEMLLKQSEAAIFLRVGERTLERWRAIGGGPPYRQTALPGAKGFNQKVFYKLGDLKKWAGGNENESVADQYERVSAARDIKSFINTEIPFWFENNLLSPVLEHSEEEFFARLGKVEIIWVDALDAIEADWEDNAAKMILLEQYNELIAHEHSKLAALREKIEVQAILKG